jgi:hypothetical protein
MAGMNENAGYMQALICTKAKEIKNIGEHLFKTIHKWENIVSGIKLLFQATRQQAEKLTTFLERRGKFVI